MSDGPESVFTKWLNKYRYINISLIYLGTALVVIHFAEAVIHGLHMPDITFSLIVVLALAGLPIVLLIAWALGNKKEEIVTETSIVKPKKRNWLKIIAATALSIIFFSSAIYAYNKFFYHSKFTGKERSIAVLPFINMSSDKENEYFSDGVSSEITNQLIKIGSLDVRAWSSSLQFKHSNKNLKEIAEALNAAAILAGDCQRSADKIRIHVELTDVNTNKRIWGEVYEKEWGDIFSIQSELAEQIASELNAGLTHEEKKKIEKKPTNSPEAYEYYLQGYHLQNRFWETKKQEYFDNSRTMFEKALALDSNYALAHAGLADLYNTYLNDHQKDSLTISLQLKEIEKAWKIDSTIDYVNNVRGSVEQQTGNKEAALGYFKRAVEINPNSEINLWGLAVMMFDLGLIDESKLLLDRTVKIDPLTASNFSMLGISKFFLGMHEEGIKDLELAIQINPDFISAMDALAQIYASTGRLDDSKKMVERTFKINPSIEGHWKFCLAIAYAKLGNKKKALELAPNDWGVLLALGMTEEAIKAMPFYDENKKEIGSPYLIFKYQLTTKDFNLIKDDPRFLKIFERSKKQYEENKKKFSIAGILKKPSSSTP